MTADEIARAVEHERLRAEKYITEVENRIDPTAHPRVLKIQGCQMAGSLLKDFDLLEGEAESYLRKWSNGFFNDEQITNALHYGKASHAERAEILASPSEIAEKEAYVRSIDPRARLTPEELAEHDAVFDIMFGRIAETTAKKSNFQYELWDDCKLDTEQPALIEGVLDHGTMSVLYAESGQAKTTVAHSMAYAVTAGVPWFGRAVEQGAVVYIQAESARASRKRIAALKKKYNQAGLPFILIASPVDLSGRGADVQPILTAIQEAVQAINRNVVLIVIDTLARAFGGGNENAAEDMGSFIGNVDRLRHVTKAHVMVIHHSGKDRSKGARGSSALRAATDTEIEIERVSGSGPSTIRKIKISKQRDSEEGQELGFRLEKVVIGHDKGGHEISSVIIQPCDLRAVDMFTPTAYKAGSPEAQALTALRAIGGAEIGASGKDWLGAYRNLHMGATAGAKTTFYRIKKILVKAGDVQEKDGLFRIGSTPDVPMNEDD